MASVNKWIGIGNLGKDPEIRSMPNGKSVASFSMACSESWKDKNTGEKVEKTEWVNCTAFDKLADTIGQYLKKGKQIYIEGRLQTDKYEKDGQTKYSTKVVVSEMKMLGAKGESDSAPVSNGAPAAASSSEDEGIPF
jgi:single-strand DNA-binding protein